MKNENKISDSNSLNFNNGDHVYFNWKSTIPVRITYARIDMTDELGTNTVSFQD